MLDHVLCQVKETNLVLAGMLGVVKPKGIDDQIENAFVAFGFDGSGAVGKGFSYVSNQRRFVFELRTRRFRVLCGRLLPEGQIGEVIVRGSGVNQALGEGLGAWSRLE